MKFLIFNISYYENKLDRQPEMNRNTAHRPWALWFAFGKSSDKIPFFFSCGIIFYHFVIFV